MTREEAIENIKLIRFIAALTNENSFKEALDMAIEALSQPSLPSNLDEAAIQAHIRLEEGEGLSFLNIFKAGAEWMAEQGVSVDSKISKLVDCAWVTPINEKQFMQDVCDNFISGDEVIVQIRKK